MAKKRDKSAIPPEKMETASVSAPPHREDKNVVPPQTGFGQSPSSNPNEAVEQLQTPPKPFTDTPVNQANDSVNTQDTKVLPSTESETPPQSGEEVRCAPSMSSPPVNIKQAESTCSDDTPGAGSQADSSVEASVSSAGNEKRLNLEQQIESALKKESTRLETDREELVDILKKARIFAERAAVFRTQLSEAIDSAAIKLQETASQFEEFEPDLKSEIASKQQGLVIVGKMIARIAPKIPPEAAVPDSTLPTITQTQLQTILEGANTDTDENTRIDQEIAKVGHERYQKIAQSRDIAMGIRNKVLKVIEKEIFPILDALDDGEKYSISLLERRKDMLSEASNKLRDWASIFEVLRKPILKGIGDFGVHTMGIMVGAPIDYNQHQVFDVEPDESLPDEHIKSLVRAGYVYENAGDESCVLRPAQVVAVKNGPNKAPDAPAYESNTAPVKREANEPQISC